MARAIKVRNSGPSRTGAVISGWFHVVVSRFPHTTMRYFARMGLPCSSNLIVARAIDGSIGPTPVVDFRHLMICLNYELLS